MSCTMTLIKTGNQRWAFPSATEETGQTITGSRKMHGYPLHCNKGPVDNWS